MTVHGCFAMNFRHGTPITHMNPNHGPLSDKCDPPSQFDGYSHVCWCDPRALSPEGLLDLCGKARPSTGDAHCDEANSIAFYWLGVGVVV